jgi:hypothetical protein
VAKQPRDILLGLVFKEIKLLVERTAMELSGGEDVPAKTARRIADREAWSFFLDKYG